MEPSQLKALLVSYTYKVNGRPTHIAGPPQDCARYLRERAVKLTFIEQPSPISNDLTVTATVWQQGHPVRVLRCPWTWPRLQDGRNIEQQAPGYYLGFKLSEWLATLYLLVRTWDRYDLYIGVEAVNAVVGVWLRRCRRVRWVVYDVIDYSPERFASPRLNRVFHWLDRWCAARVDFCWNQTVRVEQARAQRDGRLRSRQLVKPSGVSADRIRPLPLEAVERHVVIYVGTLQARDGAWLMLEALPAIVRAVPRCVLRIIGAGNEEPAMQRWLRAQGLEDHVHFLGMIGDPDIVEAWVAKSRVALAPYRDDAGSVKRYNDPSKPRLYLACGVPVVITRVPPVAEEIEREHAGVAVEDNPDALAHGVIRLLRDEAWYRTCRDGALRVAHRYTWDQIFDRLFHAMS